MSPPVHLPAHSVFVRGSALGIAVHLAKLKTSVLLCVLVCDTHVSHRQQRRDDLGGRLAVMFLNDDGVAAHDQSPSFRLSLAQPYQRRVTNIILD